MKNARYRLYTFKDGNGAIFYRVKYRGLLGLWLWMGEWGAESYNNKEKAIEACRQLERYRHILVSSEKINLQ
jgi:hypothetical protein